jgi:hypothetical protein
MDPKDDADAKIHVALDLDSYFQERVISVAQKQGVSASPFATQYLARVLSRFSNTENFLPRGPEGRRDLPKLALLWLESLEKTPANQYFQLQLLGDVALFTSGFFAERVKSSAVDLDYYAAMGGRAYERAGQLRDSIAAENALNVFFELSQNFSEFVEVFAEISDQTLLASDKDILKLYQKWLESRSGRIARMLGEKKVIAASGRRNDKN